MAFITADRVLDSSTSTGTGAFVVSGTPAAGYRTFSAVMSVNDTCYYSIQGQTTSEWEVGLGTYSSANTLTRTTVYSSSNANAAVSFSAGTKDVFITIPASVSNQSNPSGNTSTTGTAVMGSSFLRNRIINGDMRIDQRNAGASVTASTTATNVYTIDRWHYYVTVASKFTVQQNAGSVTPPAGFTNYLGVTSSSAYTVGSGDIFMIRQPIEGFNVSDFGWGAAGAKSVTLSFWVRSSLTGTFGGALCNNAGDRSYPFSYSISSANTWTQVSVTIAGDTSGTWLTTNGVGIYLQISLGTGTTYSGTVGAWAGSYYASATGATSVVGTNGATFYFTGVQFEVGSVATPFERQIYSNQLSQCQRYYRGSTSVWVGTSGAQSTIYTNGMRTAPTISGGGTGFTSSNQTTDTTTCYQTTAANQTLTFNSEF